MCGYDNLNVRMCWDCFGKVKAGKVNPKETLTETSWGLLIRKDLLELAVPTCGHCGRRVAPYTFDLYRGLCWECHKPDGKQCGGVTQNPCSRCLRLCPDCGGVYCDC